VTTFSNQPDLYETFIMGSTRRIRLSFILAIIALITLFYVSTGRQSTETNPFYQRSRDALNLREAEEQNGRGIASDDAAVQQRLQEAADKAKQAAEKKATEFHGQGVKQAAEKAKVAEDVKGELRDAKDQEKLEIQNKDKVITQAEAQKALEEEKEKERAAAAAAAAARKVAQETLDVILKKSPSMSRIQFH
jgi:hypothetical protein